MRRDRILRPAPEIPDHTVLRKIGGGSYGEVWMAKSVTDALRAVKVLWREDFDHDSDYEREFKAIQKYEPISRNHPGLISILHVGRSQGEQEFYYYLMELGDDIHEGRNFNPVEYEPRNLRTDFIAAEGSPLDLEFCVNAGRQISDALSYLHSEGLAHRDIKPANIIFMEDEPRLADIGLVATSGQRTFVGTEGFVPPEGPGSEKADVYSLGKVLYEMSTGHDRLDFPSIPKISLTGEKLKSWRALNSVICQACDSRLSKRTIQTAKELNNALTKIQAGKTPRKKRPLAKLLLFSALAIFAGGLFSFNQWKNSEPLSPIVSRLTPPEKAPVKIISEPSGAEVWDNNGEFLGTTPLRGREETVGQYLEYEFHLEGYRNKRGGAFVIKEGVVIDVNLEIFSPPKSGEPWSDALGMRYSPNNEFHESQFLVSKGVFNRFLKGRKLPHDTYLLEQKGVRKQTVFTTKEIANQFCNWLEKASLEQGYLTDEYEITPELDPEVSKSVANLRQKEFSPFRCIVRKIPFGLVTIFSEPEGANVYFEETFIGITSFSQPLQIEKIRPGNHSITLESEGFKPIKRKFKITPDQIKTLNVTLNRNDGVVFDAPWENSNGFTLIPLNDSLMVSSTEATVDQFSEFTKANSITYRPTSFQQNGKHPAVGITREEAQLFCEWLTEKERFEERIGEQHRYRLPTDLEWSKFNGITKEQGESPSSRDLQSDNRFPWGVQWPPKSDAGNFADENAIVKGSIEGTRSILNYKDGYAYTAPVASFTANEYGIFDLAGNVFEWVSDSYTPSSIYGVVRGSSWKSYQKENLKTIFRNPVKPEKRAEDIGFRVVLEKTSTEDLLKNREEGSEN